MLAGPIVQVPKKIDQTFTEGLIFHVPSELAPQLSIENPEADGILCSILDTCAYLAKGVSVHIYLFVIHMLRIQL